MAHQPILKLQDISYCYGAIPALQHINLDINPGSLTAIIGPNGGGKSTLLKLIAGILSPQQGRLERHVQAQKLAYLPQTKDIDRTFPIRIEDVVGMGLWSRAGSFRRLTGSDHETILKALADVNLQGFEKRSLEALSGGQLQRVFFARVIAQDASIILLDEPFTGVDARTTQDLLGLVQRWHSQGKTILAVMHDLEQVRCYFPEVAIIAKRVVSHGVTANTLDAETLVRATFYV